MENFFKNFKKSLLIGAGLTAMSPATAQKTETIPQHKEYQAKDLKDYQERMELYTDSLKAYEEYKKTEKIYQAGNKVHNRAPEDVVKIMSEISELTGSDFIGRYKQIESLLEQIKALESDPELEKKNKKQIGVLREQLDSLQNLDTEERMRVLKRFNVRNEDHRIPDQEFERSNYTKNNKNKPKNFKGGSPGTRHFLSGEDEYLQYPVFQKPTEPIAELENQNFTKQAEGIRKASENYPRLIEIYLKDSTGNYILDHYEDEKGAIVDPRE